MCVLVDGEVIDAGVLYFRQTMMPPVPPWVEEVRERERERERDLKNNWREEGSNECVKNKKNNVSQHSSQLPVCHFH